MVWLWLSMQKSMNKPNELLHTEIPWSILKLQGILYGIGTAVLSLSMKTIAPLICFAVAHDGIADGFDDDVDIQ